MTAAERRAKNNNRNRDLWKNFKVINYIPFAYLFHLNRAGGLFKYSSFSSRFNKKNRNGNKRLITYLNRKARAEHMKAHGKTPKHVPTIREMYLNSK